MSTLIRSSLIRAIRPGTIAPVDTPVAHFAHCPRCGARQTDTPNAPAMAHFAAHACGFTLYLQCGQRGGGDPRARRWARRCSSGVQRIRARASSGCRAGSWMPARAPSRRSSREVREEVGLELLGARVPQPRSRTATCMPASHTPRWTCSTRGRWLIPRARRRTRCRREPRVGGSADRRSRRDRIRLHARGVDALSRRRR